MSKGTTRRAALSGAAAVAAVTTTANAQSLGDLINRLSSPPQPPAAQNQPQAPAQKPQQAGRQSLAPLGYALGFTPVRAFLMSGNYSDAMTIYRQGPTPIVNTAAQTATSAQPAPPPPPTLFSTSDVFLCNSELGLMNFDAHSFPQSTECFAAADSAVQADHNQQSGSMWDRIRRTASHLVRRGAAFVSGHDEIAVYQQRDYERILQLNYLALSYLVAGDRRAYNVNRLAIEEQDLARRNFETEIGQAQERLNAAKSDSTNGTQASGQTDAFSQEFAQYQHISDRVPSAYVNPMGFYLSGVIQEITSAQRPALRGTARASYEQALALAGSSQQLTNAVAALRAPPGPSECILHVIIGEGFAPSRQALQYGVQTSQQSVVPVRIPIFTPNASSVTRLAVTTPRGQPIARLDPCGDVEAMVMRSQHDRMPQILIGVIASAWRSSAEQHWAAGMGEIASAVMTFKQSFDSPDMRSWCTLPAKFHIARIRVPSSQPTLKLTAYSGDRVLQSQTLNVPPGLQQCVAYGRVLDGALSVEQPRRLWIDAIDDGATTPVAPTTTTP